MTNKFRENRTAALPPVSTEKPTHTNQYLALDSPHPHSVKRGIVKRLYNCAKRLVTKQSVIMVISEEKKHLVASVLVSNGYPPSFVTKLTLIWRL